MWQKNLFPLFSIYKCIKKFLDKLFIKRKKTKNSSTKKETTVSLEILGKISLQLKRQLIEIFRTSNKDIKLKVVFRSFVRVYNAFRFNDQIPKCINSMLLRRSTCNTCNNVYIGKAKMHYSVRQFEYLGSSVLIDKVLRYCDKDATTTCYH